MQHEAPLQLPALSPLSLPLLRLMFQFKCHKMSQRSQLTSVLMCPTAALMPSPLGFSPSPSLSFTDLGAGPKILQAAKSNTLGGKPKKWKKNIK